jgi:hypothetical protein
MVRWIYESLGSCKCLISLIIIIIIIITTYLRTELSPSWEAANYAAIQEIPSNFKEPERSSPRSQEPSTGPYHRILSLQDYYYYYY